MRSLLKRTLVSGITAALVASASIGVAASGAGRTEGATAIRSRPQSGVGQAVARTPGLRADVWPVTECGTYSGRGCSPTSARVDLERPTFSNPTNITNPLFPISTLESEPMPKRPPVWPRYRVAPASPFGEGGPARPSVRVLPPPTQR